MAKRKFEHADLERSTSLQTQKGSRLVGRGRDGCERSSSTISFLLIGAAGPVNRTRCRCIQLDDPMLVFLELATKDDTWIRTRQNK